MPHFGYYLTKLPEGQNKIKEISVDLYILSKNGL